MVPPYQQLLVKENRRSSKKSNAVDTKEERRRTKLQTALKQLNLFPLVYDREQKDLIFFYKCMYVLTDFGMSQYVEVTTGRKRAATSGLLRTQACKTSTFQSSHFVIIVKLWNYVCTSAPSYCYVTVSSFKSYLRKTYIHLTSTSYTPDLPSSHSLITTQ